ncbi:Uncharacterized protein PBTT_10052 [Plasmodiophora brassicae]
MASTDDGAETSSTPRKRVKRTPGDDMAYHPPDTLSPSSSVPHRFTVRAEVAALPNRPVQPLSPPASSPRATTRARWTNRLIGSPSPTKVPLQDALATMIERSKSRPGPPTTTTPFRTLCKNALRLIHLALTIR